MKNIFRHIVLVYLAFFMLLASVTIPYSAMTCNVSNTKSITLLENQFSCVQNDSHTSCTKKAITPSNTISINKSTCCLFDNGIIDAEAELIISQTVGFQAILAYLELPAIPADKIAEIPSQYAIQFEIELSEQPIRIMQQSFLC